MTSIILCGLPKSGKTTLGKKLAAKLHWTFIDTDVLIENAYFERTGRRLTCREIYQLEGESRFREVEYHQINCLDGSDPCIISLGGGGLREDTLPLLQKLGVIIYLKTSLENVWGRLKQKGLPAYLDVTDPKKTFSEIAQKRIEFFEKSSQFTFKTEEKTFENLWQVIHSEIFSGSPLGANRTEKPSVS